MPVLQKNILLAFALLLAVQSAISLVQYMQALHSGMLIGDFSVFWHSGRQLAQGEFAALYDVSRLYNASAVPTPGDLIIGPLLYPPQALFVMWPVGWLGYGQGLLAWSLLPLLGYFALVVLMVRRTVRDAGGDVPATLYICIIGLLLPFLCANLFAGQTATLIAALFMGACYFWGRRPVLAGICLAFMTIKPQLGVLIPFALIASREWRIVASACVTALLMVALSTLWLGASVWAEYFQMTQLFMERLKAGIVELDKLALGPYVALRGWAFALQAPHLAAVVQAVISIAAAIIIVRVFVHTDASRQSLRFGMLACAALLATPYTMCYDSPLLAVAIVPLCAHAWQSGWRNVWEILAVGAAVVIVFMQPMLVAWQVPYAPLAVMLLLCVLYRRYEATLNVRR